jgi:hypothetical protein
MVGLRKGDCISRKHYLHYLRGNSLSGRRLVSSLPAVVLDIGHHFVLYIGQEKKQKHKVIDKLR